jgi:hypothetical protein
MYDYPSSRLNVQYDYVRVYGMQFEVSVKIESS